MTVIGPVVFEICNIIANVYMMSKVPSCLFSGFLYLDLIYNIGISDLNILRNIMKTAQDYYKRKCEVSGETAAWKSLTWSNSKWPPIGQYLLSHACYLVNHTRWLDHYYVTKSEVFRRRCTLEILNLIEFKMTNSRSLFTSIGLKSGKAC